MLQIPQSTSRVVMLKLFTTGTTTAATGKTVAITISKAGGAFGNPNAGATNATEVSNGWYKVTLDTTDTATLGDLVVRGTATACDDTERVFAVVKATNAGLTGIPDAAPGAPNGLLIAGSNAAVVFDAITVTNNFTVTETLAIGSMTVSGDLTVGDFTIQGSLTVSLLTRFLGDVTASGLWPLDTQVAAIAAYLDTEVAAILAAVDTEVAAIKAKTDLIPAAPASTTNITAASGVSLAATGLDAITVTESAGRPTTFPGFVRRVWEWVTNKQDRNRSTGVMNLYAEDNSTVLETRTQSNPSSNVDQISKGA